jgi:hypothetical protein
MEASRKLGVDTSDQLREAHVQVLSILNDQRLERKEMKKSFRNVAASQHDMQLVIDRLEVISQQAAVTETSTEVLKSLQFSRMHDRHSTIHERHGKTFSWIFEANTSPFKTWLEEGSGTFWISGKAGSGKSTLMKHLSNSPTTKSLLQRWANANQLIVASFYFWVTGTEMQRSQEGLLQSILYEILRQEPDLIPTVLPSRWQQGKLFLLDPPPWRVNELYEALDALIQAKPKARFCIFIDGLDEYSGDAGQQGFFAEQIMKLSESPSVKICVASRPWTPFKNVFGRSEQHLLTLETLTRDDMEVYVRDLLQKDDKFAALLKKDPSAMDLVREIRNKARGVFLWVVLVVNSLRSGLTLDDDLGELKRRLDNLPPTLKQFFRRMLDTIDENYKLYACRILYLAHCAGPLPLRAFFWVRIEYLMNENYATRGNIKQLSGTKENKETAKIFLNNWTRDLLEVYQSGDESGNTGDIANYQVGFIHRTVGEFLSEPEVHEILQAHSGKDFDPDQSICRVLLAEAKSRKSKNKKEDVEDMLEIARRSVYHAKQYEIRHQRGLKDILRELDNVVSSTLKGSYFTHWTASFVVSHPDKVAKHRATVSNGSSSFLAYAVASNLVEFVRESLDSSPNEVQKKGRPLLDFAIYPTFPRHNRSLLSAETDYSMEMIDLLLRKGAVANQHAGGLGIMTTWQMFLLDMCASARGDDLFDKGKAWDVAQLFLTHGADRRAEVPIGKDSGNIDIKGNFGAEESRTYERVTTHIAGVAECLEYIEQQNRVEEFLARLPESASHSWTIWTPRLWWNQ